MGDGGHNVPFVFDNFGLRRLTESECLRMQGFDEIRLKFPGHLLAKDILKMAGNAVSVDTVFAIISEIQNQLFTELEEKDGSKKRMALSA
jgi:DNA (cytosine-5)-methyltransferase 1